MNMTEKNGQPSMEEILASIRRIIAEEPSYPHNGELRGTPILVKGDGVLDDASEFDLPAIFRSSPPPASERPAPLLGRLTDAIRSATTPQVEMRGSLNGADHRQSAPTDDGAADAGRQALSSLKTTRPETSAEVVRQINGTGISQSAHIAESQPIPSQSGAFPSAAPASASEAKRVMAPFKDTRFKSMAGPAPEASAFPLAPAPMPAPAPAPPQQASAPPPQAFAPAADFGAIIPAQFDRPSLVNGATSSYSGGVQQAPVPQAAPHVAAPSAMPPPPLPVREPIQNALVAAPTGGEEAGGIEDATADLLRPMLRQWLADNMPRMVEKALHIEMAESIKAPKKT